MTPDLSNCHARVARETAWACHEFEGVKLKKGVPTSHMMRCAQGRLMQSMVIVIGGHVEIEIERRTVRFPGWSPKNCV